MVDILLNAKPDSNKKALKPAEAAQLLEEITQDIENLKEAIEDILKDLERHMENV